MKKKELELLTTAEVADVLGVSRSRVDQLAVRSDFPAPFARTRGINRTSGLRLWKPVDIDRFAKTWERQPGRPRRAAAV